LLQVAGRFFFELTTNGHERCVSQEPPKLSQREATLLRKFLLMWTCCSLRETVVVLPYAAADLQPLVKGIRLRRRYNNSLCRVSVWNRFNCPHPAEASIPIVVPASATALRYLHAPMIAIGRNCEHKCNRSRHDDSAQNSNEKHASHFVCPHFPYTIIEGRRHAGSLFGRAISPKRLWCAAFLAQSFRRFVSFLFGNHE
jgi:hypothetical protein